MAKARARARVLVVCADAALAASARSALAAAGYAVRTEPDSVAGLLAVEAWQPAVVVLDWTLPFITAPIVVHALRAVLDAPPPVVALDGAAPSTALAAGATAVVAPSQDATLLVRAVTTILRDQSHEVPRG